MARYRVALGCRWRLSHAGEASRLWHWRGRPIFSRRASVIDSQSSAFVRNILRLQRRWRWRWLWRRLWQRHPSRPRRACTRAAAAALAWSAGVSSSSPSSARRAAHSSATVCGCSGGVCGAGGRRRAAAPPPCRCRAPRRSCRRAAVAARRPPPAARLLPPALPRYRLPPPFPAGSFPPAGSRALPGSNPTPAHALHTHATIQYRAGKATKRGWAHLSGIHHVNIPRRPAQHTCTRGVGDAIEASNRGNAIRGNAIRGIGIRVIGIRVIGNAFAASIRGIQSRHAISPCIRGMHSRAAGSFLQERDPAAAPPKGQQRASKGLQRASKGRVTTAAQPSPGEGARR